MFHWLAFSTWHSTINSSRNRFWILMLWNTIGIWQVRFRFISEALYLNLVPFLSVNDQSTVCFFLLFGCCSRLIDYRLSAASIIPNVAPSEQILHPRLSCCQWRFFLCVIECMWITRHVCLHMQYVCVFAYSMCVCLWWPHILKLNKSSRRRSLNERYRYRRRRSRNLRCL